MNWAATASLRVLTLRLVYVFRVKSRFLDSAGLPVTGVIPLRSK